MRNLTLPVALVAYLIGGCMPKPLTSAGDASKPSPGEASVTKAGVAYGAEVVTLRGLYRPTREGSVFDPCGTPGAAAYEVVRTPALDEAYRMTTRQGFDGQSVVATLTGRLEVVAKVDGGSGQPRAPRRFYLEAIDTLEAKNPRNTCIPYTFWAFGSEPFWNLEISRNESIAEWSALGENAQRYEYAEPLVERGGKVTRYVFPGEQRLKVTVVEEPCTGDMSGNRYPFAVTVERAGKSYTGCAQGPEGTQ